MTRHRDHGDHRQRSDGQLQRVLFACAVTAGWCVIGGILLSSILERTGLLASWIESDIQRRLAGSGGHVEIGSARIAWLDRSVVLREVTLHAGDEPQEGQDRSDPGGMIASAQPPEVRLAELRLVLQLGTSLSMRMSQVGLRGGHVHVSHSMRSFLQRLQGAYAEEDTSRHQGAPSTPKVRIEGLDLAWEGDQGMVHLGRSSAAWTPGAQGSRLWARLDLAAASQGSDHEASQGLVIRGELSPDKVLSVRGQARNVLINEALLPLGTPLAAVRDLMPSGRLSLDLNAHHVFGNDGLPQAELRVEVEEGGFNIPEIEEDLRQVRGIDLALRLVTKPGSDLSFAAEVSADVQHLGMDLQLRGQFGTGREGPNDAEFWAYSPAIGLNDTTMALARSSPALVNLREMLLPAGTATVAFGINAPKGWRPGVASLTDLSYCAQVLGTGDISLAYVGARNIRQGGQRNLGFPRRVHRIHGRTAYTYIPNLDMSERLGFFDLSADAGPEGRVQASGSMFVRPAWLDPAWKPGDPFESEFSLEIGAKALPVDDELRASFAGLSGVSGAAEVITDYDPNHGQLDFDMRIFDALGPIGMALDLDVQLDEVDFRWSPCPLPIQAASGQLRVLTNGDPDPEHGRGTILFDLSGSSESAQGPLSAAGKFAFHGPIAARAWSRVHGSGLQLRSGSLRSALEVFSPETLSNLEGTAARGWVDVDLDYVKPTLDSPRFASTSITPTGPGLLGRPQSFPMDAEQVHGRILVRSEIPEPDRLDPDRTPPSDTRIRAELLGAWLPGPASVPLAMSIDQPVPDETHIQIRVAGLDPNNPTFIAALRESKARSKGTVGTPEITSLSYTGHIDGSAEVILGPDPAEPAKSTELHVQARLDHLRFGDKELLRDLNGLFSSHDLSQGWEGERLTAMLGNTPVELANFTYAPTLEGNLLETKLSGTGLPIDEDHLRHFLDEDLLRTLLDDLQATGTFDVENGQIQFHVRDNGQNTLEFDGDLAVRDAGVLLGVPVKVDQARKIHLALGVEGGRVRALAQVAELDGALAERSLTDASFQMTFLDTRLTIEELSGNFEGGSLRPLGASSIGPATFFSIDLVEPFDFSLSADLEDVDAGRLLAGMFNSDFANEGALNAEIRLHGAIEELTEVQGKGRVTLRESALWSIPVFQSLFSQLGFDTTAVFSRMESKYQIDNGRVALREMRMKSDLLSLVGDGWFDFDGSMAYDLRVRYSLVDRLGPFTKLLYWIQNNLLRVSIRGDMSRPRVLLKGLFSRFYRAPRQSRRLPLPGLSSLPRRF